MRKILSLAMAFLIIFNLCLVNVSAYGQDIKVYIDGVKIDFDVSPVIDNGRTLVPIRAISEYLKYEVNWNNEKQEAEIENDGNVLLIGVNKTKYIKNGEIKEMDVPAKLVNGRTLVPVRLISESFGCKVDWDNDTFSVYIKTQPEEETQPAEKVWSPDFSDFSNGSINNPFCANLMYVGEDIVKPSGYEFEYKWLEYQPSNEDDVKKIKINSTHTIEGEDARDFIKKQIKKSKTDICEPSKEQTWWVHKVIIEYVDGIGRLNINKLINSENLYIKTGGKYETSQCFIIYEKELYGEDSLLEVEKNDKNYTFYLCTLVNKSDKNPLLRILCSNGESAKYIHLNSYIKRDYKKQLGIDNNKYDSQQSTNNSNSNYSDLKELQAERAQLVSQLNSALASNMGRESSYTKSIRDKIKDIDKEISKLK